MLHSASSVDRHRGECVGIIRVVLLSLVVMAAVGCQKKASKEVDNHAHRPSERANTPEAMARNLSGPQVVFKNGRLSLDGQPLGKLDNPDVSAELIKRLAALWSQSKTSPVAYRAHQVAMLRLPGDSTGAQVHQIIALLQDAGVKQYWLRDTYAEPVNVNTKPFVLSVKAASSFRVRIRLSKQDAIVDKRSASEGVFYVKRGGPADADVDLMIYGEALNGGGEVRSDVVTVELGPKVTLKNVLPMLKETRDRASVVVLAQQPAAAWTSARARIAAQLDAAKK